MFKSLLEKECRQIIKSMVFYIYVIIFVAFITSQLGETQISNRPQIGQEDYGQKKTTDKQQIMSVTLSNLVLEIKQNNFATSPFGFYKPVILSDNETAELKVIAQNCIGKSWNEIERMSQDKINANVDYDIFKTEMSKACKIIGKGSAYEQKSYENTVEIPMTYEEAVIEYNDICEKDGITDSYMRLYCDYAGIVLGLFPIFIGVTRCVRDKRSRAFSVIYSKSISSIQIILTRYISSLIMIFIPVVVLAFALQTPYMYQAHTLGVTPHIFSFLYYSFIWLLPTVAAVLAVSFFLTELFNGIIAIIVQVFWAMASLMTSFNLVGNFGMKLILRWNRFGETAEYINQKSELIQNRFMYVIFAIVMILLTAFVYDKKRKGEMTFHAKKY